MPDDASAPIDWHGVALDKLGKILGADAAQALVASTLKALGLQHIDSADNLYRVGKELAKQGGFIAMAGSMLSIHAQLRAGSNRTF
jgi:hypothetical protein